MARSGNKRKGEIETPSRWSNEVTGVLWMAGGLLLLLSLVRYSPADLPRWSLFEAFSGKSGVDGQNLIGPVGGILAFIQIVLFGAAAFLVPVMLIWFGVIKLAFDGRIWPRCTIGFIILLLSGAAFLEAADFFFKGWANRCNIATGPGGVMGHCFGGLIMVKLLGQMGTIIVTLSAYAVAMILVTGQKPIAFTKACAAWIWDKITTWWHERGETGKIERREREFPQHGKQRQRWGQVRNPTSLSRPVATKQVNDLFDFEPLVVSQHAAVRISGVLAQPYKAHLPGP